MLVPDLEVQKGRNQMVGVAAYCCRELRQTTSIVNSESKAPSWKIETKIWNLEGEDFHQMSTFFVNGRIWNHSDLVAARPDPLLLLPLMVQRIHTLDLRWAISMDPWWQWKLRANRDDRVGGRDEWSRGGSHIPTCLSWCLVSLPGVAPSGSQAAWYGARVEVVGPTSTAPIKLHDFWSSINGSKHTCPGRHLWKNHTLPVPTSGPVPISCHRQTLPGNASCLLLIWHPDAVKITY